MSGRIAIVGSYNQDFTWRTDTFPVPGETRLGRFATGPGGKGFNQAMAAARQGAHVAFIGALGCDAIGEGAAALAKAEGIDARWQWCENEASGTAAIVLDAGGQNLIIVGSGANLALTAGHVEAQADAIAATAVTLVQHEVTPAATRRALELARAAGTIAMLNPAPPLSDESGALLPLSDLITPNETEFAHLLARCAGLDVDATALATLSEIELHVLARRLPVQTLVLTLGSAGVFVSHGDHPRWRDIATHYRLPAEAVQVRDTTGAGDAFSGSLAAALAERNDAPFADAIRHANRVAGLATESHGAASAMPTREAVKMRFG